MASFIIRRLIASIFVLLAATFLMYMLVSLSGDPLGDLRASNSPNKDELMAARTKLLNLDVPPPLRYFLWLGAVVPRRLRAQRPESARQHPARQRDHVDADAGHDRHCRRDLPRTDRRHRLGTAPVQRIRLQRHPAGVPLLLAADLLGRRAAEAVRRDPSERLARRSDDLDTGDHRRVTRRRCAVDVGHRREVEATLDRLRRLGHRDSRSADLLLCHGVVRRPQHRHRRLLRARAGHRFRHHGDLDGPAQPQGGVRLPDRRGAGHRALLPDDELHPQRHDALVLPAARGARRGRQRRGRLVHGRSRPRPGHEDHGDRRIPRARRSSRSTSTCPTGRRTRTRAACAADRSRPSALRRPGSAATSGCRASTSTPICCCRRSRSSSSRSPATPATRGRACSR